MIPHEPPPRRRKTRATVKLDLTRDLYRRVRRLARDTGQDVHELAREALELYMDEIEGAA